MTYKKLLTWMKEHLIEYWRYWVVAGLGLLAAIIVFWRLNPLGTEQGAKQDAPVPRLSSALNEKQEKVADKGVKRKPGASGRVVIDLKGAVNHQGVVDLPIGSRLQDAIQQAGGLTDQADRNRINLAQLLVDGQALYIEKVGEEGPNQTVGVPSGAGNVGGARAGATSGSGRSGGGALVNLNTASAKELEALDGIGPKKAEQIVAFREEKHRFQSVEDLKEVGGIGPKRFEQLKNQVTV
ncbi:helix-hairpin-helix domain-containing protein [Fructobacillus cardui]|uniref:Contains SLBB domain of the beta-grasp fold (Wza) n=1 Tax=Fructobacillus cardui TaxID=2893170 RepID=A0ABN9YNU8_9LACO|nr:helix-hairpin-helix domain-containing protein [uncultured Fructobacillus sp.]CAK1228623.1 Periplasmic protein Wza involved in polysaccharide export [Fructobacillus cardui]CAK1229841.1 Periplasmic protein Wza involved in polysaccharide export [Fructobacillus cardui]CAK1230216.1 Periplasmic protein Wza involved in polysaccharide export [Fructobacillus cardui]